MPGSPRGLENSLKIGPLQNHIWSWVAISYKVFVSIPTRIKQNHPRRTHKKTYLQKWLPTSPCQKEKSEREKDGKRKHQDSTESSVRHMGPAASHKKPNAPANRMPAALFQGNVGYSIFSVASWGSGDWSMCPFVWLATVKMTSPARPDHHQENHQPLRDS